MEATRCPSEAQPPPKSLPSLLGKSFVCVCAQHPQKCPRFSISLASAVHYPCGACLSFIIFLLLLCFSVCVVFFFVWNLCFLRFASHLFFYIFCWPQRGLGNSDGETTTHRSYNHSHPCCCPVATFTTFTARLPCPRDSEVFVPVLSHSLLLAILIPSLSVYRLADIFLICNKFGYECSRSALVAFARELYIIFTILMLTWKFTIRYFEMMVGSDQARSK